MLGSCGLSGEANNDEPDEMYIQSGESVVLLYAQPLKTTGYLGKRCAWIVVCERRFFYYAAANKGTRYSKG